MIAFTGPEPGAIILSKAKDLRPHGTTHCVMEDGRPREPALSAVEGSGPSLARHPFSFAGHLYYPGTPSNNGYN
jgi:hypothetical protein